MSGSSMLEAILSWSPASWSFSQSALSLICFYAVLNASVTFSEFLCLGGVGNPSLSLELSLFFVTSSKNFGQVTLY